MFSMIRILFACMLVAFTSGCGPRYVDYFPYCDDGTCKPVVAIIPVFDSANCDLPWNISEELTRDIRCKIMDNGELYLQSSKITNNVIGQFPDNMDYFGRNLSFACQFPNCEFLVVMEVIEHKTVPYVRGEITPIYKTRSNNCQEVLVMKVRLKVIDLRGDSPCVTLQEIVQSNHMIPRIGESCDLVDSSWGTDGYYRTSLGIAHQRLVYDIVNRIESVTWKAR